MHFVVNYHLRDPLPQLPYMIRSAGYYTSQPGFHETNDGSARHHCGLFWCLKGQADFTLNGETFTLSEGQFLPYLPHASHEITVTAKAFQYYWMTFEGKLAAQFLASFKFPDAPVNAGPPPVELWDRAFKIFHDNSPDADYVSLEIVSQILARAAAASQRNQTATPQRDAFLKHFLRIVRDHCHDPLFDLNAAARLMRCHRSTLLRNIRPQLKSTPASVILSSRLNLAIQMLSGTDLPITRISEKAGFASPAHFSKTFRKFTGMTPSQFRKAGS